MCSDRDHPVSSRLGALLFWFAALGGPFGWAFQLLAVWGIDEVACGGGHQRIAGVPLRIVLIVAVVGPGLVVLAALVDAIWVSRRLSRAEPAGQTDEERRSLGRARLVSVAAILTNTLFLAIIILDGANLWVFPPCQK